MQLIKQKSLKTLLTLIIISTTVFVLIGVVGVLRTSMMGILGDAEYNSITELSLTIDGALDSATESIRSTTRSWANWTETYNYVIGDNPAFLSDNIDNSTALTLYGYDYILIKDLNGRDIIAKGYSYTDKTQTVVPKELSGEAARVAQQALESYAKQEDSEKAGIVFCGGKAYFICTMPITYDSGDKPVVGSFTYAQICDNSYLQQITKLKSSEFFIDPEDYETEGEGSIIKVKDSDKIEYIKNFDDVTGNRLHLVMRHERTVYKHGESLVNILIITFSLLLVLLFSVFIIIIQRKLIKRVIDLSSDVGSTGPESLLNTKKYGDYREFGILCTEINEMVLRLETNRKTAEETETTMTVLQSILNSMDAYLYATDPETDEILFINDKMREHYSLDENAVGSICWKVLQSGFTERCDFCPNYELSADPEGTVIWEEHSTVTNHYYRNIDRLIDWPGGKKVHLQHSTDVTDMKMAEIDLIKAKEQAENSSMAKGDFLSRMSHEMRTPMNAIIGMTKIAQNSDDPVRKEYCLDKINNASTHLLGVINDILDMSKIEANKFELSLTDFNLERMIISVVGVVNFRIEEKAQQLVVSLDPGLPAMVKGDEQRLAQVITNLLTNAVKFTPEEGKITLSVELEDNNHGEFMKLKISVTDTGIGISQEQQQRLFNSFEQADGGISRKFGGTGLGLAISKKIVELMDGEIWIESEIGSGAKFTFTVSLQRSYEMPVTVYSTELLRKDLKILVVDDLQDDLDCFSDNLKQIGASCECARSGQKALKMLEESRIPYDIIFIDWRMPEMNGIELAKRIKEKDGKTPVIVMISIAEWSDIEKEALEAGISSFLPKPLFPANIRECLNKYFGADQSPLSKECGKGEYDFSGKTIMVAEDIEINREIVGALLEDTGVKLIYAENGQEAVDMFHADTNGCDLILMDMQMPEVDGLEATRRIRGLGTANSKNVTIIAMTANAFREDVEKCLEAGMNGHISKPIEFELLLETLRKHLILETR